MKWNTQLYDTKHAFVSAYGEELIKLLDPKAGERILDLGCGTGDLAQLISQSGAKVTGLDSSKEMIQKARAKYPDIPFDQQSATNFSYDLPFDAVFSNATLHWVLEPVDAIKSIHNCLKPNGRFVAEFGGKGNVYRVIRGLKQVLAKRGYHGLADKTVWYFPSLSEYTSLLEEQGFRVVNATHFDRDTPLDDEQGIKNWLRMFGQAYLENIPDNLVEEILEEVEQELMETNYRDGIWYADYVRLRVLAIKI